MEANRESPEPVPETASAASVAMAASVLGGGDLHREILLSLPTALVRAAALSRRWLRCASDPAFLSRFRARHPPHLLGFYVNTSNAQLLRIVPLAWDPELATVIPRGNFDLGEEAGSVRDCRNGRVLVSMRYSLILRGKVADAGSALWFLRDIETSSWLSWLLWRWSTASGAPSPISQLPPADFALWRPSARHLHAPCDQFELQRHYSDSNGHEMLSANGAEDFH